MEETWLVRYVLMDEGHSCRINRAEFSALVERTPPEEIISVNGVLHVGDWRVLTPEDQN